MSDTYNYQEGAIHNDHRKVLHVDNVGSNDIGKLINAFFSDDAEEAETVGVNGDPIPSREETADPAQSFVDILKLIMKNAEKENGNVKPITARGHKGSYIYQIKGEAFGEAMDDLLNYHNDTINDYLEGADAKKAVMMKYVCPFLGAVLDTHLFSPKLMPKIDLAPALNIVYGEGSSAPSKLSAAQLPKSGKILIGLLKNGLKNLK